MTGTRFWRYAPTFVDKEYIEQEISRSGSRVCCLELVVEHMTGKLVKES